MRPAIVGLMIVALVASAGAARAERDPDSLAEELQRTYRDFDPETLEAGISFVRGDGSLQPGIRCATRPVDELEPPLINAAIAEKLGAGRTHRGRVVVVPVQFTILRTPKGNYDVTDRQVDEQIDLLNRAFAGHGFRFVLQGVERYSKTRFAKRCLKRKVERKLKARYAVDPAGTLNIYSCRPTKGILGFAHFPFDYPEESSMHGVVLLHSSLPGGSAFPYDLGYTAVHEVGHYLGLFHTFQGACGPRGDRVDDTPREKSPASGCPVGRDTCMQEGLDPVTNYMDYSDDACMEEFTDGQAERMQDLSAAFRPGLGK